ncbi:hypothetical protein niasHS_016922 [Heterodera schachtii]|uniref:Uncharacterized protein n=1 Tax=Heterodera schachtii TaxID=97005 RepID=A0ABD2HW39_HETSC
MYSRSPTPKSERRHQIRLNSRDDNDGINNNNNMNNNACGGTNISGEQQRAAAGQSNRTSVYHQICAINGHEMMTSSSTTNNEPQLVTNNNFPWALAAPGTAGGCSMSSANQQMMVAAEHFGDQQAVLIYKMQLLHCVEVATKRLLFHLVKTSASMPNLFRALPFLLFVLSFLCFFAFSPRSAAISFHLLPDSFNFGGGSVSASEHNGPCLFARSINMERNQFPEDNPAFDATDKQSLAEFVTILTIRGNNQQFNSVLPPSNRTVLAFVELFERIQQITISHQKLIYKWYDMCRQCRLDSVVAHLLKDNLEWTFPEAIEHETDNNMQITLASLAAAENQNFSAENSKIFLGGTIGDVQLDSSNGKQLRRARSLLMRIKLKPQLKQPILIAFELDDELEVHYFSAQRWTEEMENAFRNVHLKMFVSAVLITFILMMVGTKRDAYESRPLLGFNIALVLAICIFSIYIVLIAGTGHLNPLLFPIPYVLVPIGILCFCNINSCLDRYSGISMHPTEKLAFIFIWDGPCLMHSLVSLAILCVISALFITNSLLIQSLLAFAVGFLCLLLFSLFLIVCWLNYARRVASGLKWFQFWRTGDQAYNEKQMFDYDSRTSARLHEKLVDTRPSFARRVGALSCSQHFRMVSFAAFTVACFAAIMWSKPTAELGMAHFVPTAGDGIGSSRAFLHRYRTAFPKYENYLELDFDGPLDYEERKEQIFALLRWPLEAGLANKAVSWLAEFDKYKKNVEYRIDEDSILPLLMHAFLPAKQFHKFASDVYISQGHIQRSRMYLELSDEGRQNIEYLMHEILSRARHAGLPLVLKVPFSFNPVHDLWVIPHLNSALITVSVLSALLNVLQPATAVCLLLTNMFLWTTVRTIGQQLVHIPLNIVTLSTLLFGILFNSATVLHFAYHFFNSGLRHRESTQRVQYAFQCTFWPILLSSMIGPVSFSVQLIFEQHPPLVLHVWQMLTLCSAVIFLQTITVLPGLLVLFADYFHFVFTYANQLCDENANAALTVDPMANNVYFVPHNNSYSCPTTADQARYNSRMVYPINHHQQHNNNPYTFHSPPCLPPAYFPPSIEFQCRSVAQQAINQQHHHHRLHSNSSGSRNGHIASTHQQSHMPQGNCSPGRLSASATVTTVYNSPSPSNNPRRRQMVNEGASNSAGKRTSVVDCANSRNESMESCRLSDHHQNHHYLNRCKSHPSLPVPSSFHQLQQSNLPTAQTSTSSSSARFIADHHHHHHASHDDGKKMKEEQIYEEPDSPETLSYDENGALFTNLKKEKHSMKL